MRFGLLKSECGVRVETATPTHAAFSNEPHCDVVWTEPHCDVVRTEPHCDVVWASLHSNPIQAQLGLDVIRVYLHWN